LLIFADFDTICWQIAESLIHTENFHAAIMMLELGERVERKLDKKTNQWRKRIAESYEMWMKQREKDASVALLFCQQAIENYRKIKDEKKIKELEKRYFEIKNSLQLDKYSTEIDLTEYMKECRKITQEIVEKESDEIIKILMGDREI
jgi:hypothetical protein